MLVLLVSTVLRSNSATTVLELICHWIIGYTVIMHVKDTSALHNRPWNVLSEDSPANGGTSKSATL